MKPPQEPIGKLLSQVHRQHQRALVKELLPYGIGGGGQYSFLKLILNQPGITQERMTGEMKFDKATTARAVKQLEHAGYLERRVDPADRRSALLYPTSKAEAFAPQLNAILAEFNQKLAAGLTSEEVDQLVYLLQKLSRNSADF